MPLPRLVDLVNLVASQARPDAGVLGPVLFAGERGAGARPLGEYAAALRVACAGLSGWPELVTRLRLLQHPVRDAALFANPGEYTAPPAFYGGRSRDEVDRGAAWDLLATCGYVEATGLPVPVVSTRRIWLALDVETGVRQSFRLPHRAGVHRLDLVTWAGDLGRVWAEWHRWRVEFHRSGGNEPRIWDEVEKGLDFTVDARPRLVAALTRRLGAEDLYGSVDALRVRQLLTDSGGMTPADALEIMYDPAAPPYDRAAMLEAASPALRHGDREVLLDTVRCGALWHGGMAHGAPARPLIQALNTSWSRQVVTTLADWFATLFRPDLAQTPVPDPWPSGFLVHRPGAAAGAPLYGGFDLQHGDADAGRVYGGTARPADAGGRVAQLVADLASLGFTGVPAGTSQFDENVRATVREFQIEASQPWLFARLGGADARVRPWRRYLGQAHGVVDWETRRCLQIWLELPRVPADGPELSTEAGVTSPRNPVRICACRSTPATAPREPRPIFADDLWAWDSMVTPDRRVWAFDRLRRVPAFPADEPDGSHPGFGGLDPRFASADVHAHRLGRWLSDAAANFHGPSTWPPSDTWTTTVLTWPRFLLAFADAVVTFSVFRVMYAASAVETGGKIDALNCYDRARLSLGPFHWTLFLNPKSQPGDPDEDAVGELGAMLSFYKHRAPAAFRRDFQSWGVDAVPWPPPPESPGKYLAPVLLLGLRRPGDSALDRSTPRALNNGVADLAAMEWFRSWRSFFRVMTALRTSPDFLDQALRFGLHRLDAVRAIPLDMPNVFTGGTLGDIVTSEQGWAALMRYHINMPGLLVQTIAAGGAVAAHTRTRLTEAAQNAFPGALPVAPAVAAADARFQEDLVDRMVTTAPQYVGADLAINAQVPAAGVPAGTPRGLSNAPGSFIR
ncbi:hypothetical protein AB0K60_16000 [Thermopolyspora sp. NPDC052614]|uniref:hypothetical protein n=1 Tax=Thermopolyspora sp. NPDC052614 TaxID=3155682 RepID=UPI0034165655